METIGRFFVAFIVSLAALFPLALLVQFDAGVIGLVCTGLLLAGLWTLLQRLKRVEKKLDQLLEQKKEE